MKTSLKNFLDDLYSIDPGLKAHEAEIIPLVEKLIASDPAQEPNEDFVKRLRMQLQNRAGELSSSASTSSLWQKIGFALGGAVTAAVIIPLAFVALNPGMETEIPSGTPLFGYSVEETGSKAFGSLTSIASGPESTDGRGGGSAALMGGDAVALPMPPETKSAYGAQDMKMIAPWPWVQFEYTYEGTLPDLAATIDVYKRKSASGPLSLSQIASSFNLGTIGLGTFNGLSVDQMTLMQSEPFGYQIYLNLRESSINIDAAWKHWPMSKCQTEACFQNERVKLTDIPADDVLIGIAKDFADDHNIDLSHYGAPEVNDQWKRDYERTPDKSMAYVPDTIMVTFPLLLEGKPVYDQGGGKMGIGIGVHLKHRRVMNAWGIADSNYLKSDYAGVTDEAKIQEYLSKIDNYGYGGVMPMERGGRAPDQPETKKLTVVLGEPTVSLSVYYRYTTGVSEELIIPSLVFGVQETRGGDANTYMHRTSVVVPLAQEMLDEQLKNMAPAIPLQEDVRMM